MADVFDKSERSRIMARVRGRGNVATELAMVSVFKQYRITGWRRHLPLFGRPDFVFRKQRLAIFVDGCFWHSCRIHRTTPSSNSEFWAAKLQRNKCRDGLVTRTLRTRGWKVMRIWQHELKSTKRRVLHARLRRWLKEPPGGRIPGFGRP